MLSKTVGTNPPAFFVYDATGSLVAEYGSPNLVSGTRYLSTDHLGSTRLVTKADGSVDQTFDYLPFGYEIGGTASTGPSQRFTEQERDAESGLDFFQARYMSGPQGRFMSPDPSGLGVTITNPQSWNKYAYVRNKPLTLADENGLYPTAVHNEIDRRAFASLSPTDLAIVEKGSSYQDRLAGQAPSQAYPNQ